MHDWNTFRWKNWWYAVCTLAIHASSMDHWIATTDPAHCRA